MLAAFLFKKKDFKTTSSFHFRNVKNACMKVEKNIKKNIETAVK